MTKLNTQNSLNWYAVYTRPRSEKKVKEWLDNQGFESYLPLRMVKRQWSDRAKTVEMPLISSYVFVRCKEIERRYILYMKGILNFVFASGKPAVIRDDEMERMWNFLADYDHMKLEVLSLKKGEKVKVQTGPLSGLEGRVIYTNNTRVSVRLESIGLQIQVNLEGAMLNK